MTNAQLIHNSCVSVNDRDIDAVVSFAWEARRVLRRLYLSDQLSSTHHKWVTDALRDVEDDPDYVCHDCKQADGTQQCELCGHDLCAVCAAGYYHEIGDCIL